MKRIKLFKYLSLILLILSTIFIYPNFEKKLPEWWRYFFPQNSINLGLDLKGGIFIVLGVDEAKINPIILKEEKRRIKDSLIAKDILIRSVNIRQNNIVVSFFDRNNLKAANDLLTSDFEIINEESLLEIRILPKDNLFAENKDILLKQVKDILNNRIDQFGVIESSIQVASGDRIIVQIPGVGESQRDRIINIISKTALLEFKPVIQESTTKELLISKFGQDRIGNDLQIYESPARADEVKKFIITTSNAELKGTSIDDAFVAYDELNRPYIAFAFDSKGSDIFSNMTEKNIGNKIAIILDGKIKSAPVVQEQIFGRGSITGNYTFEEANDLAIVLKSGSLPIPISILQEKTIGPSLGQDSINRGKISMIIASILIFIFMILYYRKLGVVCDLALIFNIFSIFGLLSLFGVTLTFPGIAGLVLTLGMAVDGNIIIYERIREEMEKGKERLIAIDVGFEKSLSTILDANITTLIASFCLFLLGDGPIKGFALTLSIGIFSTIFSNVIFTRVLTSFFIMPKGDIK